MIVPDMSFRIMNKDVVVAFVEIKGGCCVMCEKYTNTPSTQLFPAEATIDFRTIERVFLGRCWEEHRADNQQLLRGIGLEEYNPFLIVQRTKGVSTNDAFWFKFEGDETLTWNDVNPRRKR